VLAASPDASLRKRPLLVGALAAVALGALQAWALLAGTTASVARADRLLHLGLLTAVALSGLAASRRHEGRARVALVLTALAAQVDASVQVVHLWHDLLRRTEDLAMLDALGTLALGAGSAAALWLVRRRAARERALRVAVEWALVALALLLLLHVAPAPSWPSDGGDGWVRAAGAALLVAALLLTWPRQGWTASSWPRLPHGLAVLAAGLALQAPSGDRIVHPAGFVLGVGLAMVAAAIAAEARPPQDAAAIRPDGHAATALVLALPLLSAVTVALWGVSDGPETDPAALLGVVGLGLLAAARGHLLSAEVRAEVTDLSQAESAMRHRAFHDELTGLANRALFLDRLTHALDLHRRHGLPLSILYCDLDGFKQINDRYGHHVGDELLVAVALRLRECLRPEDTLARLGGDEFVLLLEHGSSPASVADRLRMLLQAPFSVAGNPCSLRMSIGTAHLAEDAPTPAPEELLGLADADMYRVKRGCAGPATAVETQIAGGEPVSPAALARALHSGAVQVVYQPVVDVHTGIVHGLEALARWAHDGRVLMPEAFVGMADDAGMSATLTDVVLEQACAQLRAWSTVVGHSLLTMSVNVSAPQLADPALGVRVREAADRHGLLPEQLVIETSVAALTSVRVACSDGLQLSVADFSGDPDELALLTALPVRSVKLLGARCTAHGAAEGRLLRVLLALGREIDVRVVVERVERPEELTALRELDADLAQGYLVSRPAPASELHEVMLRGCLLPV
jgi:diguanylate cyclase (GGDEF)-like protein